MKALSSGRIRLVAAVAGVNIVLAAGGWLVLVSPQRQHGEKAAQQVQQTQTEVVALANALAHPTTPKQPKIPTADLYKLAQAMPATADEPDMLLALGQLARGAGVHVLGVSPQSPTAAVGYTVLPVELNVAGNYGQLTTFLRRLRELVAVKHGTLHASGRLFSVTSIALTPGTGSQLSATIAVDAFVFGAVAGVTPQSSTPTSTSTTGTDTTGTTTGTTTTTPGQ